jgi:DNA-binding XRE family transcriptional regulator
MNLKEQRKTAGKVSQIELARTSGVSRFRISLAESGHIVLRDDERLAIQEALAREIRRLSKQFREAASLEKQTSS